MAQTKSILVIGAGDATGAAIAKRFAREGYAACVMRRDANKLDQLVRAIEAEGGRTVGFAGDAAHEGALDRIVETIEREIAPLGVAVFNSGGFTRAPVIETAPETYRKVWEDCCFGGFLMGRAVAARMAARGEGTILFTGATAALRGGAGFSAFAGAKFALRALAQSMARELGPKGIHVAHAIIDGIIDTDRIAHYPEMVRAKRDQGGLLSPEAIAEAYWQLHRQPRDAWSFEIDLRPWMEQW